LIIWSNDGGQAARGKCIRDETKPEPRACLQRSG
jgi:hypothetical protein